MTKPGTMCWELGIVFDTNLSFSTNISSLMRSCWYQFLIYKNSQISDLLVAEEAFTILSSSAQIPVLYVFFILFYLHAFILVFLCFFKFKNTGINFHVGITYHSRVLRASLLVSYLKGWDLDSSHLCVNLFILFSL